MPKLNEFKKPELWLPFSKAMSWVNRILMLHGVPLLRDVPGLKRLPGFRGLADVRQIIVSADEIKRLRVLCADGGATFLLPNHPEFFTDWMLDKEIIARAAPECASWATNGVVNGMGGALQKFWLWNNLVAQIPGNSEPARNFSVDWALQGKCVLLHPEGAVGWHADYIADLMPGAANMALAAKEKSPNKPVRLVPIVWKLTFQQDATDGLLRECAYVVRNLKLAKPARENPATQVAEIYQQLFDREAEKLSLVTMSKTLTLRQTRDALDAAACLHLEAWLADGVTGRDASAIVPLVKRKSREEGEFPSEQTKSATKLADRLSLIRRLGDFAFERPSISQEEVAEHLKRLRNDWCRGSWRDTANKFIPQPVARRNAHIRVLEAVEVHGDEKPAELMSSVRLAMQLALDQINGELSAKPDIVTWDNPFYHQR